jgi:hypoxanthine phosphoribosyltransferase
MISVHNKEFKIMISESKIEERIKQLAIEIDRDYLNKKPLIIAVLNGAFMFASDLMKNIHCHVEITFVKLNSYENTDSTGKITEILGLNENIEGRDVIIVEDIVDTGLTMNELLIKIGSKSPKSVEIATLLYKPKSVKTQVNLKYIGFEIPSVFVIGFGLDYNQLGRNLVDIYESV